jgi:Carboxypeptidase regulatory-like domain
MRSISKKVASSEAACHVRAALWLTILALSYGVQSSPAQGSGSIQGKVTDPSGAPIFGAVVTVEGRGGSSMTVTDMEGAFRISLLPPGNFNVKISASGMSDWTADSVVASASDTKELLAVMQLAPKVTSMTVGLSPQELAEEQVKSETQQRVAGLIPNYFVAYDNAAPLSPQQKFRLSFKTLIDPATFAAVGITAGIQQIRNSYWQFGQGSEAYSKRFGANYGTTATNLLLTSVLGASVLHQDPRYFYSGKGTKKQRAWYAIESAFRAKGDNGKWQPPYASVLGTIAAAELSQLYYPGSRTQYTLIGRGLMFHFGGLIALNLGQEFFLKKFTTHAPRGSAASAPTLREGTPVKLIAVDGFGSQGVVGGQTVTFVLAEELTQRGKDLAQTGDVASGVVTEVTVGNSPDTAGSVALQKMMLRAGGNISVPLRSNQVRGAATPVQYHELPGSGKMEITLFVAEDVAFPETE